MKDRIVELVRWCPRLLQSDFEAVHRAGIKKHSADALYPFPTPGIDAYLLGDDVPTLKYLRRSQMGKGQKVTQNFGSLHCNDGMDTENPALLEAGQVLNGLVNNEMLTACDLVTAQTIDPECNEVSSALEKLGFVQLYG